MYRFRNFYRCYKCGVKWTDDWDAMCDDDCPKCGARHCSPYKSEDLNNEDTVTLELKVRVTYEPNGVPVDMLKQRLRQIVANAMNDGGFTGETEATVESHDVSVTGP